MRVSLTRFKGLRISIGPARAGIGTDPRRGYALLGFGRCSVQLQVQLPGFALLPHVDGPEHNHALSIVLLRPERGGALTVFGPQRRFGRMVAFDGGQIYHAVGEIEGRRPRVVLLLQRCSGDASHPR